MKTVLALAASLVFLVGCSTAPAVVRVPGEAAAWLGSPQRVLVRLDTTQVKTWGQVTSSRDALKAVGERTKVAWLGFDLNNLDELGHAADTMRIVLEGDFPRGGVGFMLDWNSAWKKASKDVWSNASMGFSVSLPEEGLVAVQRSQGPANPGSGVLRDLDARQVEGAAAWISFWTPGEALFGSVGAKLLPVDRLDIVLQARDGALEGPIVLSFADDRASRAAFVVFKLLAPQLKARLGQDLEWTVEGSRLTGSTLRLSADDLKALANKLLPTDHPEAHP